MEDGEKTKEQLIKENNQLRQSVAELKVFEEEIKQTRTNQEKFTKAFTQSSISVGITTLKEGRFIDVSDAYLNLMGRKRDEVIGHTSREIGFITEEQREFFFHELQKKGRVENFEMEIRANGGGIRHGLFNAVIINFAEGDYLLTIMTDITDRKLAEEAKRVSEAKHRNIFNNSAEGLYQVSPEGRFISANPAAARILGYESPEELIGAITDIGSQVYVYPEDRDKALGLLKKDGFFKNFEVQNRHKDGSIVWVLASVQVVRDDQGNILYHEGSSKDITYRKRAELRLKEVELKFRTIANFTYDWESWIGVDGKPIWISPSVERISGYAISECMTMSDYPVPIIHPEDRGNILAKIQEANEWPLNDIEFRIIKKDGELIWGAVSTNPVFTESGSSAGHRSSIRDITVRKKLEEALFKSEEKYRQIVENIADCIFLMDKNNIIRHVTKSQEILGYSSEELIGISGFQITHPDDIARMTNLYQEGIAQAWLENIYEVRLRHKDGRYVLIEFSVKVVTDEQGEFVAGVFVARDITQLRKKVDEQLLISKSYSDDNRLSKRENEIFRWIMEGKSTWDISTILKISERTVKFHISNIMKKLSAVNRAHAVAIAMQNRPIDVQ